MENYIILNPNIIVIKNFNVDKKFNKLNTLDNKKPNFIAEKDIHADEDLQKVNK